MSLVLQLLHRWVFKETAESHVGDAEQLFSMHLMILSKLFNYINNSAIFA